MMTVRRAVLAGSLVAGSWLTASAARADYVTVPQVTRARTVCHVYAWRDSAGEPRIVRLRNGAAVATDSRCNPDARIAYVARPDGRQLHYQSRRWLASFSLASDDTSLVSTWNKRLR